LRLWIALKAAWASFRASWRGYDPSARFRLVVNGRDVLLTDNGAMARREMDRMKSSDNTVFLYDGDALRGVWTGRGND
jgi:hypothetical protein